MQTNEVEAEEEHECLITLTHANKPQDASITCIAFNTNGKKLATW